MSGRTPGPLRVLALLAVVAGALAGPVAAADDTRFATDGDGITVEAAPGRVIDGETDRTPGSELTVRLRSADAETPFLKTATTTVEEDGTFRARFDLSDVPVGATFDATVSANGTRLASATGEVVCAGCATPDESAGSPGGTDEPTTTTAIHDPSPVPDVTLLRVLALVGALGVVGVGILVGVVRD